MKTTVLVLTLLTMVVGCASNQDANDKLEQVVQERQLSELARLQQLERELKAERQKAKGEKRSREILARCSGYVGPESIDGHRALQTWKVPSGVIYIVEKHFVENPAGLEDAYASALFFPYTSKGNVRSVTTVVDFNGIVYDPNTYQHSELGRAINAEIDRCWIDGRWQAENSRILKDLGTHSENR